MKAPRDRNSPINQARKDAWLNDFVGYRTAVNQGRIEAFLKQFRPAHRDVAARVLDCVEFYGPDRVANAYRAGLAVLPGWSLDEAQRTGRWRFAPMSGSSGDSGGTMSHQFRLATGMARKAYDSMFVFPSSLVHEQLGVDDTVVLLDDFVGTGEQVANAWKTAFAELVAGVGIVYLMVVAACRRGRERLQEETELTVYSAHEFDETDNFFAEQCQHFTPEEKQAFKTYCRKANRREPAGYGDCGLLLVFSHRCPNDSVAALHATNSRWRGLFPRND